MEHTGIPDKVTKEICSLARKHHIEKVLLFGSRARGSHHRTSDIDLAVCGGNISRFALDVEEETSTPLKYDFVDLNDKIPDELRKSIEKDGIVLYEKI